MKIGTFLLGGIAGAAAVIYLNRKSKSLMMSAFSSSSESMGKVMGRAKDSLVNNSFKESFKDSTSKSFSPTNSGNATGSGHLNQVEKVVKEDPSLKATVNEILQENHENTTTIQ
ncbi:hypothetical protein GK047_08830 [Paenibacillus sp. SYP-B3998]|uniref:Uncharacterized protein n=1 Tax=Paenibacillus sp. SYP-B3998 TaxID=2678564 RepID=A0A6G3ZVE7_9BACL|nr:hypothetical protein [Paenibacillus sp. SYP-B3998]NEW06112.1 hypothetical protein [Paenibacillus sp. SYP-B3998]